MAHLHSIYDCDTHFAIDLKTREIKNDIGKTVIVQNDHNSERFSFELPKEIEGHDMSRCNVVQVHYLNIDSKTKEQHEGLYEVDDLQISPDSNDVVILSWLLSQEATRAVGSLYFGIVFKCIEEDGTLTYSWHTTVNKDFKVVESIDNSNVIIEEYPDILAQLEARLAAVEQNGGGSGGKGIRNMFVSSQDIPLEGETSEVKLTVNYTDGTKENLDFLVPHGKPGNDYVLNDEDKQEIAEMVADLVEVPEGGGNDSSSESATITNGFDFEWTKGSIEPTTGNPAAAHQQLNNYYSKLFYCNKLTIKFVENMLIRIFYYNEDGTFIGCDPWKSKEPTDYTANNACEQIVVDGGYIRIGIAGTQLTSWAGQYTLTAEELESRFTYKIVTNATSNNGEIEVSEFNGKRCLFIGDSITEHNYRATKNYDEYLAEWLGIESVNVAKSGTGVTYAYQGSPSWLDALANYPADVDLVCVMGALNDRHNELGQWGDTEATTVYGGVYKFFNNLIAKYPTKPIVLITSTPREYSYGETGQFTEWVNAFIKTAQHFSIPVLDLYRYSGLRPWNADNNLEYFSCSTSPNGDGVHPNEKGQRVMAQKIYPFFKQFMN